MSSLYDILRKENRTRTLNDHILLAHTGYPLSVEPGYFNKNNSIEHLSIRFQIQPDQQQTTDLLTRYGGQEGLELNLLDSGSRVVIRNQPLGFLPCSFIFSVPPFPRRIAPLLEIMDIKTAVSSDNRIKIPFFQNIKTFNPADLSHGIYGLLAYDVSLELHNRNGKTSLSVIYDHNGFSYRLGALDLTPDQVDVLGEDVSTICGISLDHLERIR